MIEQNKIWETLRKHRFRRQLTSRLYSYVARAYYGCTCIIRRFFKSNWKSTVCCSPLVIEPEHKKGIAHPRLGGKCGNAGEKKKNREGIEEYNKVTKRAHPSERAVKAARKPERRLKGFRSRVACAKSP